MQRYANPQALKHFLLPLTRRTPPPHCAFLSRQFTAAYSDSLPSVTNKEFWTNLIPKPLRRSNASNASSKPKSKEWNPATFYIWIFLLIGSMSIQMIALKNEHATFTRRADAKIGLLKEVVERVQRGEDVDVAGLLGKGDKKQEQEWHDVLKEIELEARFTQPVKTRATKRAEAAKEESQPKVDESDKTAAIQTEEPRKPIARSNAPRGFY